MQRDRSVVIPGKPTDFVDVYSSEDVYPESMWQEAASYFANLSEQDMILPGGRYSCAQVLMGRHLGFLVGRSFGQVCHIVQLAISRKKLLGYQNGMVVPYGFSQSMVKEKCAERQRPCTGATKGRNELATWDTLRECLMKLVGGVGQRRFFTLSNIKRLFRTIFDVEVSETALGYAKLSDLLQDKRLHDVCALQLQGHGYVVVPPKPAHRGGKNVAEATDFARTKQVHDRLVMMVGVTRGDESTGSRHSALPSPSSSASEVAYARKVLVKAVSLPECTLHDYGCSVRNTFIEATSPCTFGAGRRARSLPQDFC